MHFDLSMFPGLFISMAPTGHCLAHNPQLLQSLYFFGVKGIFFVDRYGKLPFKSFILIELSDLTDNS